MREDQYDQDERRGIFENDRRVRDERQKQSESSTFLNHTHIDDAGGRFAAVNAATIVGQDPAVKYPQLPSSSPWSGAQPQPGVEPPTNYRIDEMAPLDPVPEPSFPSAQAGPASAVTSQHADAGPDPRTPGVTSCRGRCSGRRGCAVISCCDSFFG